MTIAERIEQDRAALHRANKRLAAIIGLESEADYITAPEMLQLVTAYINELDTEFHELIRADYLEKCH